MEDKGEMAALIYNYPYNDVDLVIVTARVHVHMTAPRPPAPLAVWVGRVDGGVGAGGAMSGGGATYLLGNVELADVQLHPDAHRAPLPGAVPRADIHASVQQVPPHSRA